MSIAWNGRGAAHRALPLVLLTLISSASLAIAGDDLRNQYRQIYVGEKLAQVEATLGKPDEIASTSVLGVDCTRVVYTELLKGETVILYFSLGDRLVAKSFREKPLFSLPKLH